MPTEDLFSTDNCTCFKVELASHTLFSSVSQWGSAKATWYRAFHHRGTGSHVTTGAQAAT